MEHFFELPVLYKGAELNLQGRLVTFGYTYKFYIIVNRHELVFEKDDEQHYRVLSESIPGKTIDHDLIAAIITTLESLAEA